MFHLLEILLTTLCFFTFARENKSFNFHFIIQFSSSKQTENQIQMANYLKNLASDLLNLEVNTIVKNNTTNSKMSASKRMALYQIAEGYRTILIEYGFCQMSEGNPLATPKGQKHPRLLRWRFGGEFSYNEIRYQSKKGMEWLNVEITKAKKLKKNDDKLEEQLKMLTRLNRQSSNLVGMFKIRRKEYEVSEENTKKGYSGICNTEGVENDYDLFPPQTDSSVWNNDVAVSQINDLKDIQLVPDEITLIRKIWEIGTQKVLLQTIVQIDGDVTSYITHGFLELPSEIRETVLGMHNDSIHTSTQTWNTLFNTVANLAGTAFSKIFSKD